MSAAIKLTIDAADWQKQVNGAVKTLEKLFYNFEQERKTMLTDAAQPMVDAMRQGAPEGAKIHIRYPSKPKGTPRAPKGQGRPIATYYKGNLKKSFQILDLKRATQSVVVGAKLAKGQGKGVFGGSKFDAYYLHWVEFGHGKVAPKPFVRPAIISASPAVIKRMMKAADHFAAKFARQNAG